MVVKVTYWNGFARTESVTVILDDVFGTISDTINLKSQMAACSFGQLNVIVGNPPTKSVGSNEEAPGVIQDTIPDLLNNT